MIVLSRVYEWDRRQADRPCYHVMCSNSHILSQRHQFRPTTTMTVPYLPYRTSGVGRLLHLPSAEAISARPNAHPRM